MKKALYGLKPTPEAWYNRIENYFVKEGFEKCVIEYTLLLKSKDKRGILIASLYMDGLLFTRIITQTYEEFKKSMMREFDM